jgi:hypothetical protein
MKQRLRKKLDRNQEITDCIMQAIAEALPKVLAAYLKGTEEMLARSIEKQKKELREEQDRINHNRGQGV